MAYFNETFNFTKFHGGFHIFLRWGGGRGPVGQSRGQHDGVHGFSEPVKSFITFVILSRISCGKVKKIPYLFLHKTVSKFFRDFVHTSVVRGNLQKLQRIQEKLFHSLVLITMSFVLHFTA